MIYQKLNEAVFQLIYISSIYIPYLIEYKKSFCLYLLFDYSKHKLIGKTGSITGQAKVDTFLIVQLCIKDTEDTFSIYLGERLFMPLNSSIFIGRMVFYFRFREDSCNNNEEQTDSCNNCK